MAKLKSWRTALRASARNIGAKTEQKLHKAGHTTITNLRSLLQLPKDPRKTKKQSSIEPSPSKAIHSDNDQITQIDLSNNDKGTAIVIQNNPQTMPVALNNEAPAASPPTNTISVAEESNHSPNLTKNPSLNSSNTSSGMSVRSNHSTEPSPQSSMTDSSDHIISTNRDQTVALKEGKKPQDNMAHSIYPESIRTPSWSGSDMTDARTGITTPPKPKLYTDSNDSLPTVIHSPSTAATSDLASTEEIQHEKDCTVDGEFEVLPAVSTIGQDNHTHDHDKPANYKNGTTAGDGDDEADDTGDFQHVINAIDLSALTSFALGLRKKILIKQSSASNVESCEILGRPRNGSYNLAYILRFDDGVKWVARIPGYGTNPSKIHIAKMHSEYNTMKYIASKTTFKMPKPLYWTADTSMIGVAFGLITFVEGVPLSHLWTESEFSEDMRLTILTDIAVEMAKLYKLRFPKTGVLRFNKAGKICGVVQEIEYRNDGVSAWGSTYSQGPFNNTTEWFADRGASLSRNYNPFVRERPTESLLRLIIETMPQALQNAPLSLSVADPDLQNIFCDPLTGHLTGFIDMDNLHVVPVTVGSAAFPSFLLRDRDPMTDFDDMQNGLSKERYEQFRTHYAAAFEAAVKKSGKPYDASWTKLSHHTCMIEYAHFSDTYTQKMIVDEMVNCAYGNIYQGPHFVLEDIEARIATELKPLNRMGGRYLRETIAKGMWTTEDEPRKYNADGRAHLARMKANQVAEDARIDTSVQSSAISEKAGTSTSLPSDTCTDSTPALTEDGSTTSPNSSDLPGPKIVIHSPTVSNLRYRSCKIRGYSTLRKICGETCEKVGRLTWHAITLPVWRFLD